MERMMGAAPTYSSLGSWLSAVETHSQKLVNHRRIRTEILAVHHRLFINRTFSKLVEPTSAALVIFLLARQASTPSRPIPQVGEVVQPSPFFKETIYLITNNLSDFNDYEQLFLLLIKKYYILFFFWSGRRGSNP